VAGICLPVHRRHCRGHPDRQHDERRPCSPGRRDTARQGQEPHARSGTDGFGREASPVTGDALPAEGRDHEPTGAVPVEFYRTLGELAEIVGGPRLPRKCHGADDWPREGVYFLFETGEVRADGRDRVVRLGTHALTATSQAVLWGRLRQHRGHVAGTHADGGNHRASASARHGVRFEMAADLRRDLPSDGFACSYRYRLISPGSELTYWRSGRMLARLTGTDLGRFPSTGGWSKPGSLFTAQGCDSPAGEC
jgi:hypothetical protein